MRAHNEHSAGQFRRPRQSILRSDSQSGGLFAALDLGTNSCRMLIARPCGAEFEVVDTFSKSVQLGAGLAKSGSLTPAAINRTLGALRICGNKLHEHGVKHSRLVATEACRRAQNGSVFVEMVKQKTGLDLEIISPAEEARLAVVSCAPHLGEDAEQLLIVDIGGGSTELVWLDLNGVASGNRIKALMGVDLETRGTTGTTDSVRVMDWKSVPLGVTTLKDVYLDVGDDCAKFALMSCCFEEKIAEFAPAKIGNGENCQIIGTSGTVTTVAASHLGLLRYERSKVDGVSMSRKEIDKVVQNYLSIGPWGRRRAPCIGALRYELIMSGAAILQAILRVWPSNRLTVADRGLREGLLYSQMTAAGVLGGRSH